MKKNNKNKFIYFTGKLGFYGKLKMLAVDYAFNLEELKKDIQCPQLGYDTYGKLGALDKIGIFIINELIRRIEYQDEIMRELYKAKIGQNKAIKNIRKAYIKIFKTK